MKGKFGEFITAKRKERNLTLRGLASSLGIAPAYMSDIEKSTRNAHTQDILDKIADVLELTNDEKNMLLDLAATDKDAIAQDLTNQVSENSAVRVALRKAKELKLGEEEWLQIIEEMEKK